MSKVINVISGVSWEKDFTISKDIEFQYIENGILWEDYLNLKSYRLEEGFTPLDIIYYTGECSPGSSSYFAIGKIGDVWYLYEFYDVDGVFRRVYNEANISDEFAIGVWNLTSYWPTKQLVTSEV